MMYGACFDHGNILVTYSYGKTGARTTESSFFTYKIAFRKIADLNSSMKLYRIQTIILATSGILEVHVFLF